MTMLAFQQAFARLAASPALCRAVRTDPDAALIDFDLTPRERQRLAAVARQQGMDVNCTLYRGTRLAALNAVLPVTLRTIGPALRDLVDGYWDANPAHEVRFADEAARFIAWLDAHGERVGADASDVLALACAELAQARAGLD